MKLSNTARAIVDVRKLRDYCLSREHPRGQHKARVFQSALGWTAASAEEVRRRLLEVVQKEEATFLGSDDYGKRYALDFSVHGPAGPVTVRSLWIVRRAEDFPRFASCYIL
ncbi:DUF6883 domain-containing protein [Candidatus Nitrospira neomarina]|uniref:DUF6883 domain-containing protein n=1 Tax=Candidatus Nitrospira neomarina TaxID=3020899 RepID=A0AA96GMV9_9BACT|nr:DUF6883 domain-containing protein [Candidatus Nitrospira neomarina]WNM63370.1 hypothetical protein PQG83_06335 [Candidatus Nitrospira neomarina]